MNKLTKLGLLGLAFATMIGLSACATTEGKNFDQSNVQQFTATLHDGTQIPCIRIAGWDGIDCNWDKATVPAPRIPVSPSPSPSPSK